MISDMKKKKKYGKYVKKIMLLELILDIIQCLIFITINKIFIKIFIE